MQGVNASSRPKPKKLAITSQKLPDSNSAAMSISLENSAAADAADDDGDAADGALSPRAGTGVLYAAADRSDRHHAASVELLATVPGPLWVSTTVVTESSWMIENRLGPGAEVAFLREVTTDGALRWIDLEDTDWTRSIELIATYADLGLGLVDAPVIAVAERLNVTTIATVNPRDFRVVRPMHCAAFDLVPRPTT